MPEYSNWDKIELPSNWWSTIFWFGLIHRTKFVLCKMYNYVEIIHNNKFIHGWKITEPLFGKENIPFQGRGHVLLQTNILNSNQFSSQCQNTVGLIQASQINTQLSIPRNMELGSYKYDKNFWVLLEVSIISFSKLKLYSNISDWASVLEMW